MDFIKEEEIDSNLFGNQSQKIVFCKLVNEVCSRVYNKAVEDAIRETPALATLLMASVQNKNIIKSEFYKKHPEFDEYREIVREVIEETEIKNPDKNSDEILTLAEPGIQKRIADNATIKLLEPDKIISGNGVI